MQREPDSSASSSPPPWRAGRHIGDMSTPGKTAAQRVIHTSDAFFRKFINLYLLFSVLLVLYSLVWSPPSLYVSFVGVGSSLLAHLCLRSGRIYLARWVFILPFFAALLITPWLVNGLRTPLLIHMMMFLVLTGWMLGARTMWVFAACFSGMLVLLWYAESLWLWRMPQPLRGIETWLLALQFGLIATGVIVSELVRNYRVDIDRESTWQSRLHSAMQFNALIIDSSPVPIRVFDPQGQCMAVNDACVQLLGQSRALLLTESLHDSAIHSAGLAAQCWQVLQTGQAAQQEVEATTSDGRTLWLRAHLVPFERHGQRHLLAHFIDLTDYRRARLELEQLAFHDSLTGLANRRLFWQHFQLTQQQCKRSQEWGAVLLLDLNRFKELNDQYGHEAGDHMLQEVAQRMQHAMRVTDVIARLGGDEFTLLASHLGQTHAEAMQRVQVLCDKLHATLSAPYHWGSITHHGSASIGVALIDPQQSDSLDTLLRQADAQMYAQKKAMQQANAALLPKT